MVHVGALPGTPRNTNNMCEIIDSAVSDARILQNGGVDAIMIENMHDRPYLNRKVGAEIVAAMTAVAIAIKSYITLPVGIQILAGANKEALAVALAAGLDFIRAEGFVFGHLADEGMMNSDAAELLRYRKKIGAENIQVFTDIKKKHSSNAISADVSIGEMAKAAEFFLSNGIVITGNTTGERASTNDAECAKKSTRLPVIIGSGIDILNIQDYWEYADGYVVGSSLKKDGIWENEVDPERVKLFMQKINTLRQK